MSPDERRYYQRRANSERTRANQATDEPRQKSRLRLACLLRGAYQLREDLTRPKLRLVGLGSPSFYWTWID